MNEFAVANMWLESRQSPYHGRREVELPQAYHDTLMITSHTKIMTTSDTMEENASNGKAHRRPSYALKSGGTSALFPTRSPHPLVSGLCSPLRVLLVVASLLFADLAISQTEPPDHPQGTPAAVAQRGQASGARPRGARARLTENADDARNQASGRPAPDEDPELAQYGIYAQAAARAESCEPAVTTLPLELRRDDRIALIGNTLLDRAQHFGHIETLIQQAFPKHQLVVRNLAWSADTIDLRPRPENFADLHQHLHHERIDVILAAFGFNESFAGHEGLAEFRESLKQFLADLTTKAFNGHSAARVVLISPIANEDVSRIPAAQLNNASIAKYVEAMRQVAEQQQVGFIDAFASTATEMQSPGDELTINGVHLNEHGYGRFADMLFRGLFARNPPALDQSLRRLVIDKDLQYFRRYRPANTFYYTGGRSGDYGYLDFLPAMRNFDLIVANRDRAIWAVAAGDIDAAVVDDSNLPPLPVTKQSRGANPWLSAEEELKAFQVDPRFEVTLFAGEEEFPDIAAPIQMRFDAQGRLWVACSTTYPHVYPGQGAADKLVILVDSDGDGKADKSTVFADDLHIPLSFELGDGGVYVSEMPDLTFLKDTNGDGAADVRERLLTGFGTEDSHHALHDFVWTPDGDLLFREAIFHHSQVETAYGPVRQQNSGWFRFDTPAQRLTSFGTYPSTNPWGVTFDDWGQHVASHPIYAAAFHALDPPYPQQHPRPVGLPAYSGTCGHEFVDFATFPDELQGSLIKVRYKPTNRIEIHKWVEGEFGYAEEYVSDLIFSTNLSFIPVDISFGPRGDLYVCDWYNPIKGHMQYSLRDDRRDRHSGRIWRITAKDKPLQDPPTIAGATEAALVDLLKRPEYRIRYWAKRELRDRAAESVSAALDAWVMGLDPHDARFRHHQLEALWLYRGIDQPRGDLLRELIHCEQHHARAAATQQLRYWHMHLPDAIDLLRSAANDASGIVRMEAAIAASYIGTRAALDAMLDVLKYPREGHLQYAITTALGSHTLRRHWENHPEYPIEALLKQTAGDSELKEPPPNHAEAHFDAQRELATVRIGCIPERMKFTREQFAVTTGQPVKLVFTNADATDHNLLIVQPGALEEVGMAANEMARDPRNATSDFIPEQKRSLILHAIPMIGPTRKSQVHVLRFKAPDQPGIYPFVCTFPGHWVVMKGQMVVARDLADVPDMLAAAAPQVINQWKLEDFAALQTRHDESTIMRGMQAFEKARCNQCHQLAGHGVNLGPDLSDVSKRFRGEKLLRQILEPSAEIHEQYRSWRFLMTSGQVVTGIVTNEDEMSVEVMTNLLSSEQKVSLQKSEIELRSESRISTMPAELVDVLTKQEIIDLVGFLESDGFQMPAHLHGHHSHAP